MQKVCTYCGQKKSTDLFNHYHHKHRGDYISARCTDCIKMLTRERYLSNSPERKRMVERFEIPGMALCLCCNMHKVKSDFGMNGKALHSKCKTCIAKYKKEYFLRRYEPTIRGRNRTMIDGKLPCTRCGELKSLDDFWKSNGKPAGWCKVCTRKHSVKNEIKYRDELGACYVKRVIRQTFDIDTSEITPEMVILKRAHLNLKRTIKHVESKC